MRKYIFMLLFSVLIISCGKEEIIKNEEKDGLCGYPKKKEYVEELGGYYYYYYYIVKYVKGIPTDTIGYCDFVNSDDYNKYIKEYGEEAYNMFTDYLDLSDSYKEQIQYTHGGNWILYP